MLATTRAGVVRGFQKDGVRVWRGIPYATAPRFQPPGPVAAWTGERDATKFGPVAIQSRDPAIAMMSGVTDKIAMSEDCLALNVIAPDRDGPHPVVVWIHGGAFVMGSGSTPLYDGTSFAARHGLVVVTLNYRLGLLGFHGGNHALLDQVAALAWVRDNIAAFGGDPTCVTAMGESAGAIAIATLLAMPAAEGLFHRAILQSGASPLTVATRDELAVVDIAADASVDEILAAQTKLAAEHGLAAFAPYVDGHIVPCVPIEGIRTRVPLLMGTNRDEWSLFEVFLGARSVEPVKAPLYARVGHRLDEILAVYGGNWIDVIGDVVFRLPMLRLAQLVPSFVYRFDWRSPAMGGRLGAAHAMELPFVWNKLDLPASQFLLGGAQVQPLADLMHDTWARFVRTGDPGWSLHGTARTTMLFDTASRVVDDPDRERREIWAGAI